MKKEINGKQVWVAPPKQLGGEDILELFARMWVSEGLGGLIAHNHRQPNFWETYEQRPIFVGAQTAVSEYTDTVSQRLSEKELYFYEDEGSIFMDYKIMRDNAFRRIGRQLGRRGMHALYQGANEVKGQFSFEMPLEEALKKAREFVAGWDWKT